MNLVIVESPTKSKTLKRFLGKNYEIAATKGHIRDLPKSKFGIDVENDFKASYLILPKQRKTIKELKDLKRSAEKIILATDSDREGEAIAWHVAEVLGLKENDYQRIVFHEITKKAIKEALKNPQKIDNNLVEAQKSRRALDRIVGYKLSPFLWKKITKGLSAGRVQSVVLKLIVEREEEIKNFKPQEYWTIVAILKKGLEGKEKEFEAILTKKDGKALLKFSIETEKQAKDIAEALKNGKYTIVELEKKETRRNPLPPFITSTLQQTAWQRFGFSARTTMSLAQDLYENGLITYHRTDALNLSQESLAAAKNFIIQNLGKEYCPASYRIFKTKSKRAQEAHEAIRPTNPLKDKDGASNSPRAKLYKLIWQRFIASQMTPALFDSIKAEIEVKNYIFEARGQTLKFDGFLKIYPIQYEEKQLPGLKKGDTLRLINLDPIQHFTQPPARYNEASLIKELEKNDIGRPSTYAPIISLLQYRNYVQKNEKKRFQPTEVGLSVNDILTKHFPKIVDIKFTASMENDLDEIAEGKKERATILKDFYEPFSENLKEKHKKVEKKIEKTDQICPKCKSPLIIRMSRFGKFLGCSNFPKCRFSKSLKENELGIKCPKCKTGKIVEKRTKSGKTFYGCSNWPKCDFALWDKPTKEKCPECGSLLVETKRKQIKCSNKECSYTQKKPN